VNGPRLGESDPGVIDRKADHQIVANFRYAADPHRHYAPRRELDRATDEVGQHLAQPQRIAAQSRLNICVDSRGDFDVLALRSIAYRIARSSRSGEKANTL